MYNHEIKERFLVEYTASGKSESSCYSIADDIAVYEEMCGADIATMSMADAIEAVSYTHMGTYSSAATVAAFVKSYVKWCIDSAAIQNVNMKLLSIEIEDIDNSKTIQRLFFRNEDELISEMKKVRPFDDGYLEVVVMLFCWLGVKREDVLSIKIEDVNLDENYVVVDNGRKIIPFSDKIKEVFTIYSKTKVGTRLANPKPRQVYRDDSYNHFVRKFCPREDLGKEIVPATVVNAISKMNQAYISLGNEARFTSSNVERAGALHRLYELEKTGVDVLSLKNKKIVLDICKFDKNFGKVIWLYKNYKKAFNL